MNPITIDQLAKFVKKQQQLGNGSKFVLMSSDDECNEYHPAWEGLDAGSKYVDYIEPYQVRGGVELKDCVILT
jgi:hypothetical protein